MFFSFLLCLMVGMTPTVIAVGVILYVECGVGCGPLRLVFVSSHKLFTQVEPECRWFVKCRIA